MIKENSKWKQIVIKCPVCGSKVKEWDVCQVCNWQNTGEINLDGGPNEMTLEEAKKAYANGKKVK